MDKLKSSGDYLPNRKKNSECALGDKTNDDQRGALKEPLSEPLTEPTFSRNAIKKGSLSNSHLEENDNMTEEQTPFQGGEKDTRLRCRSYVHDRVDVKDGDALSSINTSVTNSIVSANSYIAEDSFEKFFQISREAKQELSEHVNKLLNHANESDRFETPRKNNTEIDKRYDQMNRKRNNTKRSKNKSKKKKEVTYDQDDVYGNFTKLRTLYDGANEATSYFMTNVLNKKINIERNIVKYDDMLSKHSEEFFKRFELLDQEEESMDEAETGISLVDNICEYFTYVMFLALNR
ncbi:conserved Plasmodium protein, unknown function [Plasmodium knowlesi strain H]|uniref:Uncharacterized protein n=3 Tax=Plasmodium knowlesi TaxID=5850 RepID=A0A5K1V5E7_PLAKH|nr:conserved Plasmodium protein, unknown function [Plasmodium knowlesi strain H]OTN64397.1 Uncharacterized protein PKNOH_S130190400 [Plasmodium knowlesi]CAA9989067.1 conserved Plasmodium protein, unknown function [Plasmodium knowlesi strain H]SBO27279.1 conserved Plasmodium protein, unknown function [Plasmodium knowlesi strain H]SBO28907.1 conserved Plasmodium protein, unknown function [Plasmodium knowlesi strain H]VVS78541.1 conserved Plasmodium protein, unknown function [Plasmodium knowlesi |eukprot:XP_002261416.1 hypothetical protein, conserved in Plasmodium species [Plasmodium knowlesi strain H]